MVESFDKIWLTNRYFPPNFIKNLAGKMVRRKIGIYLHFELGESFRQFKERCPLERHFVYTYMFLLRCLCELKDMELEDEMGNAEKKRKEGEGISLPPFGLATYKMQGNVWVSSKSGRDQERLVSLWSVADSWLKQLRVQHHDFNYFTGIRRG